MLISGKNDADVDQLGLAYSRAVNLETELLFQGNFADADRVDKRADKLAAQRRKIVAKRMAGWERKAGAVHLQIKNSNMRLQRQITEIKKRRENAQNIVSAIGYLDDIINAVSTLLV